MVLVGCVVLAWQSVALYEIVSVLQVERETEVLGHQLSSWTA